MTYLEEKQQDEEISKFSPATLSKKRILKNVFILCVVFFITFTAYDCLTMLQSTMNNKQGIGVTCQSIVWGCYCLTSLLLPKYVIKKLGCKLSLVLSMCFYLPYIASNLYPHWSLMVPTAILNGISGSFLWGAQCQYLNEIAIQYATHITRDKNKKKQLKSKGKSIHTVSDSVTSDPERKFVITDYNQHDQQNVINEEKKIMCGNTLYITQKDSFEVETQESTLSNKYSYESNEITTNTIVPRREIQSIIAIFFGIHGWAYLSTHMFSNIMSYFILRHGDVYSNVTMKSNCTCGANFCKGDSDCFVHNLHNPSLDNRQLLIGICLGLCLLSIITLALFLDSLDDKVPNVTFSLDFLLATSKQIKRPSQILLTPISLYLGMMQGFYAGDFNLSFIGCAWGTSHVALVSACYGAACSLCSPLTGWLVRLIGRVPMISVAAVLNISAQILLLYWTPSTENTAVFFIVGALWGSTLGILLVQVKVMYGFLYKDNQEAAFGAFHAWATLGFCISFAYSNHLCTYVKLYVIMSLLVVAYVGYLCLELLLRLKKKM